MEEHRHLPDLNRMSVLAATVLLAYAATRFVEFPNRELSFQVPGIFLSFQLNFQIIVSFVAAALAAAGMDWLISDHPAFTDPHHSTVRERGSHFQHWLLPALTAWVIGVPLSNLPDGPAWWVVFSLGGALLLVVFVAEYIIVDPSDIRHPAAAAGLTALSFALTLMLAIAICSSSLRLYLVLPTLVPVASLVALRTVYLRTGGQWAVAWAIGIALIIGQVATGLHYLPLSPIQYGLFILAPLYALTSVASLAQENLSLRRGAAEAVIMLLVLWGLGFWLKINERPDQVDFTPASVAAMREHVDQLSPEEACGMLAGLEGRVTTTIPITNGLHSPARFQMDPREMLAAFQRIERAGEELVAIYHSHPRGPAFPSATDQAEFAYPGTIYLIWSPAGQGDWQVKGFSLDADRIQEVPLAIAASNF